MAAAQRTRLAYKKSSLLQINETTLMNLKKDDEKERTGSTSMIDDDLQAEKTQQNISKLDREEQAPE